MVLSLTSHCQWLVLISASALFLSVLQDASAQIPTACIDDTSLSTLTCCPNNCGAAEGRGECANLDVPNHSMTSTNVRDNWPHYYTRACQCSGNYAGIDCSACKYGYYGDNCEQSVTLPRRSIQDLGWSTYIDILTRARQFNSQYVVVQEESRPGTTNLNVRNISLYDLFVWMHHFAAKDNENGIDYAHEAVGFLTWHRHYISWFEWEIQQMLKAQNETDYYMFRTPYWDWRRESLMNEATVFQENRLGISRDGVVSGDLYNNMNWTTVCWHSNANITIEATCDPTVKTGLLRRCPVAERCTANNPDWPTREDVNRAIGSMVYDVPPYDKTASATSFRNFLEGFDTSAEADECNDHRQCTCEVDGMSQPNCTGEDGEVRFLRRLHNVVHIIVGIGDLMDGPNLPNPGVMGDVAASPNDPLFINHHTMIDCILEEWLQRNPDAEYPNSTSVNSGHQSDDYVVPFFPVMKHKNLLMTANNFAYSCSLDDIDVPDRPRSAGVRLVSAFNWLTLPSFSGVVGAVISMMKI